MSMIAFSKHLSLFLCIKYLCRKKIVLLSVAAVMVSAAMLIVIASIFSGFIKTIERTVTDHSADVLIMASGVRIPDYDSLISEVEKLPAIQSATAVLSGYGGLLYLDKGNVRAVKINGIQLPKCTEVMPFKEFLVMQKDSQAVPSFSDDPQIDGAFAGIGLLAMPDSITDEYDIEKLKEQYLGKIIGLTTVRGADQKPMLIKLVLTDFVYSGFYMADSDTIYVPIEMLNEKLFGDSDQFCADMIQIKVAPGVDPEQQVEAVSQVWHKYATEQLGWGGYALSRVSVTSSHQKWQRMINEYRKQMNMLITIFSVVSGGVILLIACIFYLIVMTKQKDIAVVKSCGLGAGGVISLFVCFGVLVGFLGSFLGVGFGYIVVKNINAIEHVASAAFGIKLWKSSNYMFARIPTQIDWHWAGIVFVAAIIAAGIGALIPALVAAFLRPVKILRYE